MSNDKLPSSNPEDDLATRFPTAYTILFLLIILIAALTWVIPAGQYERSMNEEVGREVAVPGTYQTVEPNPQGFVDVMLAPTAGFYDPDSYVANAIDVALFVLFLGGFLGVMNATGAIDTGIRSAMHRLEGREIWMIPILMSLFALGGTTYGMAEETNQTPRISWACKWSPRTARTPHSGSRERSGCKQRADLPTNLRASPQNRPLQKHGT